MIGKLFWALFRKRLPMGLGLREIPSDCLFTDPFVLLSKMLGDISEESKDTITTEFESLSEDVSRRYALRKLTFPEYYKVGDSSSLLIYALIRLLEPRTVLETGVANGHSTYYILNALSKNGKGELWSTDIDLDVGGLFDREEEICKRWHFELIDERNSISSFRNVLNKMSKIDLFIHDSGDHNYKLQWSEYHSVLQSMADDSLLASDDVNNSYAFIDFVHQMNADGAYLLDIGKTREPAKLFGLIRLHNERNTKKDRLVDVDRI